MGRKQYVIQFGGLAVGTHLFEMEINDSFFKNFELSEVSDSQITASIELVKQNNLITLNFDIHGEVNTACDRCAKSVPVPLSIAESIVVKHGNTSETTDEILVLPHGDTEIDVSQLLYEFVSLAIPVRRVPCEEDENVECDEAALKKLNALTEKKSKKTTKEINPLWEKLNELKKNKSNNN
jgi:uncharacterized protein